MTVHSWLRLPFIIELVLNFFEFFIIVITFNSTLIRSVIYAEEVTFVPHVYINVFVNYCLNISWVIPGTLGTILGFP